MTSDRRSQLFPHIVRASLVALALTAAPTFASLALATPSQFGPASSKADGSASTRDGIQRVEVPEPASMMLLGSGLLGLAVVVRRGLSKRN